jgi:predicted LPLAT superfamily acyltransferase
MCGASHMMPGKSPADCTRACVKHGAHFAISVKDKVYILDGKASEVDKLAGSKATVQGNLNGNVLTVSSIAAAK